MSDQELIAMWNGQPVLVGLFPGEPFVEYVDLEDFTYELPDNAEPTQFVGHRIRMLVYEKLLGDVTKMGGFASDQDQPLIVDETKI